LRDRVRSVGRLSGGRLWTERDPGMNNSSVRLQNVTDWYILHYYARPQAAGYMVQSEVACRFCTCRPSIQATSTRANSATVFHGSPADVRTGSPSEAALATLFSCT